MALTKCKEKRKERSWNKSKKSWKKRKLRVVLFVFKKYINKENNGDIEKVKLLTRRFLFSKHLSRACTQSYFLADIW